MKADELIHALEGAFPSHGLECGISLRQALLEDAWEYDDSSKMRQAYTEDVTHDWKAISGEELDQFFGSFSVFTYLDDKGWRYYLPAALRHSLKNPGSDCEFYTRISLLPGNDSDWHLADFVRYLDLSQEQGRVIAKVLVFLCERDREWPLGHPEEAAQLEQWVDMFGT